jgi:dUTP pyrophosphatase
MTVTAAVPSPAAENYPADWPLPAYATPGSAAVDLRNAGERSTLAPGERRLVPTGLAIALPAGWRPRSGPAPGWPSGAGSASSIRRAPSTATIGARSRIRMINHDSEPQEIEHGERIAQLVLAAVVTIVWPARGSAGDRAGTGGFGSTGT